MFTLTVTRKCGHTEKVSVELGNVPGKNLSEVIDKIDKEERAKLCHRCHAKEPKTKGSNVTQAIITILIWLVVIIVTGIMCMIILRF